MQRWSLASDTQIGGILGSSFRNGLVMGYTVDGSNLVITEGAFVTSPGGIRVWNVATETVTGFGTSEVENIVFSPDGRQLATAGRDNVIRLWHIQPGSPTFGTQMGDSLAYHTGTITGVDYNNASDRIISVDDSGALYIRLAGIEGAEDFACSSGSILALSTSDITGDSIYSDFPSIVTEYGCQDIIALQAG